VPARRDLWAEWLLRGRFGGEEQTPEWAARLDLEIDVVPIDAMSWQRFANTPGNPRVPSLAEAMQTALDEEERTRLVDHLRPLVERGEGVGRSATAYLRATKPS
jgi:arsenite methyltransferase